MKPLILVLIPLIISCNNFPKDPSGTLIKASNNILIAGIALGDTTNPAGLMHYHLNKNFIEQFALIINARVQWIAAGETELVKLLEGNEIHLAIGRFTPSSPFSSKVGFSKPYHSEMIRVAYLSPAPPLLKNIKNKMVKATSNIAAMHIRKHKGIPVPQGMAGTALVAGNDQQLARLQAKPTDLVLHKEELVVAIPKGENGLLFELEKFIHHYGSATAKY